MNCFKQSFKYFKRKHNPEILNNVLNIEVHNTPECATLIRDFASGNVGDECAMCANLGLRFHKDWRVYTFEGLSGFFYIRNPFTTRGQRYWVQKSLAEYTRKPTSVSNLDLHHNNLDDLWSLQQSGKCTLMEKLTWITLGYHYNWDKKIYDRTKCSTFPNCLSDLAKHVAGCLHFKTFVPDAAIINYYNAKSTLGIHNDHSEEELNQPIVSISFGLTAIFLMGTQQMEDKPLPLFLKSGDIVLMSGQSRVAYHAVPAVIRESVDCDEDDWLSFSHYIKQHRINISVRQVYPADEIKI